LIDFDNVTMGIRSDLQQQLRELLNSAIIKGKVAVQRAYADWRRYPQYIVPLSEASIDLIFAPAFGSNKKNATDIRLAIDALELVFTRPEIKTFILLSGDSDFSSLVLKLKEYGKWVVGVGIRESASDLLVQNCDEYYSYTDVTGLAKEGEVEVKRRDPWELVVEAALHMRESNDTMRSDRLKQVMQQIDPHFDEKDAGYNRFSKFVLEASRRKLLVLEKLESGQYEIDLGSDANVPPDGAVAPLAVEERPRAKPPKKDTRRSVEEAAGGGALILANAFALLKRTLVDLKAVGDDSTSSKAARERMAELADDPKDPIFEPRRFNRMLRQASDANIINLVKDGRKYALKLLSEAVAEEEAQPKAEPEAKPPPERGKWTRTKKGSRPKPEEEKPASAPSAEEVVEPPSLPETEAKRPPEERQRQRSLRGRGSSRSRDAKPGPKATEPTSGIVSEPKPEASPDPEPEVEVVLPRAIPTRRSVRGRGGSRGRKPPSPRPEERREESAPPPKDRDTKGARRSTPQTGGVPRHGGQTPDAKSSAKSSGNDGPRPRRRGQRRQTTRRPSAESRGQAPGEGGEARKGGGGRNAASKPGTQGGERASRETKAASSVIEKRVVPEEPKSGGILQRMMQRLRGEEKDD
jgi:uncharacterized protein (TIGR00288 family)